MTDLTKAVEAFVDAGFAGLQVRVNDANGEWVGAAGAPPPPVDGRFWAGSVAKTFTATAVLQLVADGLIDLDAPVTGLGLDEVPDPYYGAADGFDRVLSLVEARAGHWPPSPGWPASD